MNQDDFKSQPFNGDPTGNIPMASIAGGAILNTPWMPLPSPAIYQVPQHEVVKLAETPPEVIRWALGLLTPNELAGALGVKEGTLSVWRSTGEGPKFIKLGKQVFYRLDDMSQWVWSKYPQIKNSGLERAEEDAQNSKQETLPLEEAISQSQGNTTTPWAPTQANTTGL